MHKVVSSPTDTIHHYVIERQTNSPKGGFSGATVIEFKTGETIPPHLTKFGLKPNTSYIYKEMAPALSIHD